MKFNYKFENKNGMEEYKQEFINSKVKYVYNERTRKMYIINYNGKFKSFTYKKYGDQYNAKLQAVTYLNQIQKEEQEEMKKHQEVWCGCGVFYNPLKKDKHEKNAHHKHYIKNKCDTCDRYSDTSYAGGEKFCWQCSPEWAHMDYYDDDDDIECQHGNNFITCRMSTCRN